ncbi:MAG: hypothetical protein QGH54_04770 [SAR202 cluster bacterium]|jgi:hypothetical protein|nr:hypothetical protein [SAR202 cluster bacterium]|tara:strand:- start:895 stop:1092 length:198 start_codon:yes stop_codon:yes gene_type:complete
MSAMPENSVVVVYDMLSPEPRSETDPTSLIFELRRRLNLDDVVEGLVEYRANMTQGKPLILPHLR